MKKHAKSGAIILVSVILGSLIVSSNLKKFRAGRDPAAIRQIYDLTHLHGSALDTAMKERLVSGLETFRDENGYGVALGHFAYSLATGEPILGCRAYQKVTLVFEAESIDEHGRSEGSAVNGEKPTMTLEGKCKYSSDLTRIDPLWIPVAKIMGERPSDGDHSDYQKASSVKFDYMADEWPRKWVLRSVSVQGEQGLVKVDQYEVGQILGRPFMINLE